MEWYGYFLIIASAVILILLTIDIKPKWNQA